MASFVPPDLAPGALISVALILGLSGVMSGLSGFGFSAIGALSLWFLPPKTGVPLLMALSTLNQFLSLGQLRADLKPLKTWWPNGAAPYILGGLVGVPLGLAILHSAPTATLMVLFGFILIAYAVYSIFKPDDLEAPFEGRWPFSILVGMTGGLIGGFTAFPGAPVVIWSGLRRLSKADTRSIVQPYILAMQLVSLSLLALQHPETFGPKFWRLLLFMAPIVLPGTFLGVQAYRTISDINFRRVTFMLLGATGGGLLAKALFH
jgi:uncharacterized protein